MVSKKPTRWQRYWNDYWSDSSLSPLGFSVLILFMVLVCTGFTWNTLTKYGKLSEIIFQSQQLIIYGPNSVGTLFINFIFVFLILSFFKRYFSERSKMIISALILCVIIFGVLGGPFVVKNYYNAKIAAAGYVECMDHPVHRRRNNTFRGLLPYQVWVLDPADCDPGDDWAWPR